MSLAGFILAFALQTAEPAAETALSAEDEARAQVFMREVRCMVCSGESIADSEAPMAQDMRRFVRESFAEGKGESEVRDALVERFGHEVVMRPPMDARTAPLWLAPIVMLLGGGALLVSAARRRKKA